MYTEKEILQLFRQSIHCSQIVAGAFAGRLGFDYDEVLRIAAPFGGGMFCGDTCGAVTGAIMVIGMKYGYSQPDDTDADMLCRQKAIDFRQEFTRRNGSCICHRLLNQDTRTPEGLSRAVANGTIAQACPGFVTDAIEILNEMLEDN